jgi:uncharacterized membrane protein YecN with MAPEG domain
MHLKSTIALVVFIVGMILFLSGIVYMSMYPTNFDARVNGAIMSFIGIGVIVILLMKIFYDLHCRERAHKLVILHSNSHLNDQRYLNKIDIV